MKLLGYATGRIYEVETKEECTELQECTHLLTEDDLKMIEEDPGELEFLRGLYCSLCLTCQALDKRYGNSKTCLIYHPRHI